MWTEPSVAVLFEKNPKIARRITLFGIVLVVLAIIIYALKVWFKTDYSDFDIYYKVSQRLHLGQWLDVYSATADQGTPLRYAPPSLFLFMPLAGMSHQIAREFWLFFQVFCFGLGFYFLYLTLLVLGYSRSVSRALI
jgi:hypothetical protein